MEEKPQCCQQKLRYLVQQAANLPHNRVGWGDDTRMRFPLPAAALQNGTKGDLLHIIPQHQDQTDGPVVLWILLLTVLVDECHRC